MTWIQKVRLRVLAMLAGIALAVIATVSLTAWPVWPVVGVAVAAGAIAFNSLTARLRYPTCLACGERLESLPESPQGAICTRCGSITRT